MKPLLALKVARILRDHLEIGGFDDLPPDELADVEFWIHKVFLREGEEVEIDVPWNQ